jgi:putative methyltransferase (TIGR04325 family)
VYRSYAEVPVHGPGHDSPIWLRSSRELTEGFATAWRARPELPQHVWALRSLMPLLASVIAEERGRVRILDFGGGMGTDYACLRSCLPEGVAVEYHLVDSERSGATGGEIFRGDSQIRFHSALPRGLGPLDLVYTSQAMQYVEDFAGLLRELAAYKARYFMFVSLPLSAGERFATGQINIPDTVIPYWFFGKAELLELMRSLGYRLAYMSVPDRVYDMENFPPERRVPKHTNLLFVHADHPRPA